MWGSDKAKEKGVKLLGVVSCEKVTRKHKRKLREDPGGSVVKNPPAVHETACNARDGSLIPG